MPLIRGRSLQLIVKIPFQTKTKILVEARRRRDSAASLLNVDDIVVFLFDTAADPVAADILLIGSDVQGDLHDWWLDISFSIQGKVQRAIVEYQLALILISNFRARTTRRGAPRRQGRSRA